MLHELDKTPVGPLYNLLQTPLPSFTVLQRNPPPLTVLQHKKPPEALTS